MKKFPCPGKISINKKDNTKFDVKGGIGIIVDSSDPYNPVIHNVKWNTVIGVSVIPIPSIDNEKRNEELE